MAAAGCAAVTEPAFWAGFNRNSVQGFYDYFSQITEHEPKRAAKFGLPHFCWLCINPKESEAVKLAEEVVALTRQFLDRPTVLGLGEIGLNKNSRNELRLLEMHIDLAARHDLLILALTPHLEDKLKGTRLTIDALKNNRRIKPQRVSIDHVEEHTVEMLLDVGFWAGMTLSVLKRARPSNSVSAPTMAGVRSNWRRGAASPKTTASPSTTIGPRIGPTKSSSVSRNEDERRHHGALPR